MPKHSKKAKYNHHRQKNPNLFIKSSFKTVPLNHTSYRGSKYNAKKCMAIVGKLKKSKKWVIQSILEPKK